MILRVIVVVVLIEIKVGRERGKEIEIEIEKRTVGEVKRNHVGIQGAQILKGKEVEVLGEGEILFSVLMSVQAPIIAVLLRIASFHLLHSSLTISCPLTSLLTAPLLPANLF